MTKKPKYFQFTWETGCHAYIVKAKNKKEAAQKFLNWQETTFKKDDRWPNEQVLNKENWMEYDDLILE